jgi:dTDP-4-amino-4,6-dideoxygalactose transaminase
MFTILVTARRKDALLEHLRAQGIQASVHFDPPAHRQAPYAGKWRLPVTDRVSASIVTLPIFPGMRAADVDRVAGAIRSFGR